MKPYSVFLVLLLPSYLLDHLAAVSKIEVLSISETRVRVGGKDEGLQRKGQGSDRGREQVQRRASRIRQGKVFSLAAASGEKSRVTKLHLRGQSFFVLFLTEGQLTELVFLNQYLLSLLRLKLHSQASIFLGK